jgi:hypothetical protein
MPCTAGDCYHLAAYRASGGMRPRQGKGGEGRRVTLATMDTGARGISRGCPVSYNEGSASNLLKVVERYEEGHAHA